jgi:hypothetical protein
MRQHAGGVRPSPDQIKHLRYEIKLANGLAIGATAAAGVAALSAAALGLPVVMGVATALAGLGAYGAVRKLRVMAAGGVGPDKANDSRSGMDRRKDHERELMEASR